MDQSGTDSTPDAKPSHPLPEDRRIDPPIPAEAQDARPLVAGAPGLPVPAPQRLHGRRAARFPAHAAQRARDAQAAGLALADYAPRSQLVEDQQKLCNWIDAEATLYIGSQNRLQTDSDSTLNQLELPPPFVRVTQRCFCSLIC